VGTDCTCITDALAIELGWFVEDSLQVSLLDITSLQTPGLITMAKVCVSLLMLNSPEVVSVLTSSLTPVPDIVDIVVLTSSFTPLYPLEGCGDSLTEDTHTPLSNEALFKLPNKSVLHMGLSRGEDGEGD
jgi:hypothetical protein